MKKKKTMVVCDDCGHKYNSGAEKAQCPKCRSYHVFPYSDVKLVVEVKELKAEVKSLKQDYDKYKAVNNKLIKHILANL